MRFFLYILLCLLMYSCTSNTIFKKPENLIPKDSMALLLTDMYIASAAKNIKDNFMQKKEDYMFLVYEKYKIDTVRFQQSNLYYTSKIDEYTEILKNIKIDLKERRAFFEKINNTKDSLNRAEVERIRLTKPKRRLNKELILKNSKK